MEKTILITGGAGFIGSHVVRKFVKKYPNYLIVNLDKLTYAGNLENLIDLKGFQNYKFEKGDIEDQEFVTQLFDEYQFEGVIHLAAESHVDRSITDPFAFARTNIIGTLVLLHAAVNTWKNDFLNKRFYPISTDEVYGTLGNRDSLQKKPPTIPIAPILPAKPAVIYLLGLLEKLMACLMSFPTVPIITDPISFRRN